MTRALAIILTLLGGISLSLGVLGIFGRNFVALSPWALSILGFIFFVAGIGLLKRKPE